MNKWFHSGESLTMSNQQQTILYLMCPFSAKHPFKLNAVQKEKNTEIQIPIHDTVM